MVDDGARIDTPYEFIVQSVWHEQRPSCDHISSVRLADGGMQTAAFVIGMIEQHGATYEFGGDWLRARHCRFCQRALLEVGE